MKPSPVWHEPGVKPQPYCGPACLSVILGVSAEEGARLLNKERGRRPSTPVRYAYDQELRDVLLNHGIRSPLSPHAPNLRVSQLPRKEGAWLLLVGTRGKPSTGHWCVLAAGKFWCSIHQEGVKEPIYNDADVFDAFALTPDLRSKRWLSTTR